MLTSDTVTYLLHNQSVSRYITIEKGCGGWRQRRIRIRTVKPVATLAACLSLCDVTERCSTATFYRSYRECHLEDGCATAGLAGPCRLGPNVEDRFPCVVTRGPLFFYPQTAATLSSSQVAALAVRLAPRASSYVSMADHCSIRRRDLTPESFKVESLAECQSRCDLVQHHTQRCRAVLYREPTRECILKRGCDTSSVAGPCPSTTDGSCVFARDLSARLQTEGTRLHRAQNISRHLRQMALRRARAAIRRSRLQSTYACDNSTVGLLQNSAHEVVHATEGQPWRYYTAFDCGDSNQPAWCLTFKTDTLGATIGLLRATGGISGFTPQAAPIISFPTAQQTIFVHNAAVLRLSRDEYVMVGGMQGFSFTKKHARAAVFTEDRSLDFGRPIGIRLLRGHAAHGNWTWGAPQVIIRGTDPPNCVDRRPKQTGYPKLVACEFDGRLSLLQFQGEFWMYARANLRYGALAGGRWAQVTRSPALERGWQPWSLVHIMGFNSADVDIYFFAAQINPVDRSSLVALFPISQPPAACIGMAFSKDGQNFSRPVNLMAAKVVYRFSAQQDSPLSARAGDHPVAGIVASDDGLSDVHIFVHHSPRGMGSADEEDSTSSRVIQYRVLRSEMRRLTERGLRDLNA